MRETIREGMTYVLIRRVLGCEYPGKELMLQKGTKLLCTNTRTTKITMSLLGKVEDTTVDLDVCFVILTGEHKSKRFETYYTKESVIKRSLQPCTITSKPVDKKNLIPEQVFVIGRDTLASVHSFRISKESVLLTKGMFVRYDRSQYVKDAQLFTVLHGEYKGTMTIFEKSAKEKLVGFLRNIE